ncbi:unnamed protein product [Withania somnifera]
MASAVVAGAASSSCSVSYSRNLSITKSNASIKSSTSNTPSQFARAINARSQKGCFEFFLGAESKRNVSNGASRRLEITARKASAAAKNIEVEVDKPLGLTLGPKQGGGVVITGIENGGNAARAGLKVGDQVVYTSSFFGDELWPAEKLGFTKTAIHAKPDSVYFIVSRKLTDAQKARATHICLDCGCICTLPKSFDEQPEDYACPQCRAPKKRRIAPIGVIIGLVAGIGGVGALLVYGLQ